MRLVLNNSPGKALLLLIIVIWGAQACNQSEEINTVPIENSQNGSQLPAETSSTAIEWHVKAIHPEGKTLDIKAVDSAGTIHNIKAIQQNEQRYILDIKAFFGKEQFPIKVLLGDAVLSPVKAIGYDGTIYDIKAISEDGKMYPVKGVKRNGNIIDIKAIIADTTFYAVKAISPTGGWNDVKGVKMYKEEAEGSINGVGIYAHVKAIPQGSYDLRNKVWNVKAIDKNGKLLGVKAFDNLGGVYDVKAMQEKGQTQLFDIKVLVGKNFLPIKTLPDDDTYYAIKAITSKGDIWDIKAITEDSVRLDIKAVESVGNILHIKAIASDGSFYAIKAISPEGHINDVKGVKMKDSSIEDKVNGIGFHAHVKALPHVN
jgi:hypothetical protein